MGIKHAAASGAALLAGILIAVSQLSGAAPEDAQPERRLDDVGTPGVQAGHTVRGQAWATELFGRRYNRNLLAAVAPDDSRHLTRG